MSNNNKEEEKPSRFSRSEIAGSFQSDSSSGTANMTDDEENTYFEGEVFTPEMIYEQREKEMAFIDEEVSTSKRNEHAELPRTRLFPLRELPRIRVPPPSESPRAIPLEATVVDENDDAERVREKMEEEKEHLRRYMAEETNRLQKRVSDLQEEQRGKRRRSIGILLVLVLLGVGAIGAWWWWGRDNTLVESSTDVPSEPSYLYDSPTSEECDAISTNDFNVDSKDLISRHFIIEMDVSLESADGTVFDDISGDLLLHLEERLQEIMMPELAGCSEEDPSSSLRSEARTGGLLHRYVIAHAIADVFHNEGQNCEARRAGTSCFSVTVELELFLKGDETTLTITNLITGVFAGEPLVDKLDLDVPFEGVEVTNVFSDNPTITDSPASSPTCPLPASYFYDEGYFEEDEIHFGDKFEMYCDEAHPKDIVALKQRPDSCDYECLGTILLSTHQTYCDDHEEHEEVEFYIMLKGDHDLDDTILFGYLNDGITFPNCEDELIFVTS